jgi:DNA repair exonuclease SbcCD ATPase subunit
MINQIQSPDLSHDIEQWEQYYEQQQAQYNEQVQVKQEYSEALSNLPIEWAQQQRQLRDQASQAQGRLQQLQTQHQQTEQQLAEATQKRQEAERLVSGYREQVDLLEQRVTQARQQLTSMDELSRRAQQYTQLYQQYEQHQQQYPGDAPTPEEEPAQPQPEPIPGKPDGYDRAQERLPQERQELQQIDQQLQSETMSVSDQLTLRIDQQGGLKLTAFSKYAGTLLHQHDANDQDEVGRRFTAHVQSLASKVGSAEHRQQLEQQRGILASEIAKLEQLVNQYDAAVKEVEQRNQQAEQDYQAKLQQVRSNNQHQQQMYQQQLDNWNQRKHDLVQQLQALLNRDGSAPQQPNQEQQQEAKDTVDRYDSTVSSLREQESAVAHHKQREQELEQQLEQLSHSLTEARDQQAQAPDEQTLQQADNTLTLKERYQATLDAASGQVTTLEKQMVESERRLNELRERQQRNERLCNLRSKLATMRGVLHREQLPAKVVSGYMQLLVAQCNSLLPRFGATFLIEARDGQFLARKGDGTVIDAADLSGGEACRWCVVFILAVHQSFARDLGLLVMDEPTDFLDEEGRATFAQALTDLQQILSQSRTQAVIATHAQELKESSGSGELLDVSAGQDKAGAQAAAA